MYSLSDLKSRVSVRRDTVECPVRGCITNVSRQRGRFVTTREFQCPYHGIFISPSTFEYGDPRRNFPLIAEEDWLLLTEQIAADKRETHRLGRERSEDAVTYNAFRSLERAGAMPRVLEALTGRPQASAWLTYWSHSLLDGRLLPTLEDARRAFEVRVDHGSEPDLIIETPSELIFVEVKVASGNNTTCRQAAPLHRYATRENGWYDRVFSADIEAVARRAAQVRTDAVLAAGDMDRWAQPGSGSRSRC